MDEEVQGAVLTRPIKFLASPAQYLAYYTLAKAEGKSMGAWIREKLEGAV